MIATEADPLGVLRSPHGTSGHPPVVSELRREPLRTVRVARRRLRVLLIKVPNMIHRQRLRVSIEGDGEPVKKTDLAKINRQRGGQLGEEADFCLPLMHGTRVVASSWDGNGRRQELNRNVSEPDA